MIVLGLVIVVGIVLGVTRWGVNRRPASSGPPVRGVAPDATAEATSPLEVALHQWSLAGLISPQQADDIRAFERAAAPVPSERPVRRVPFAAEALGYLGSILGLVGLTLLLTKYWPDISAAGRLGLTLGGAAGLTLAGFGVRGTDEPALERLRWFLWLGATIASGLAAWVAAVDIAHAEAPSVVALACAVTVAVHSGLLWWTHDRPVQQATCLVGALVAAGTLTGQFTGLSIVGLVVWGLGGLMLAAGILARTTCTPLTVAVGSAGAFVGSALTVEGWGGVGMLFMAGTAVALTWLAISARPTMSGTDRTVLAVIGTMAIIQSAPATIAYFAQDAGILTGLATWASGVAMVALSRRPIVRSPIVMQSVGGASLVIGAAVTGVQSIGFATLFGLATAIALLALGTWPAYVLMSLFGSIGLLVNVPWAIRHFFPGEGRVPLMILVSGVLIVAVAVWLTRMGGELRHVFHHHAH